MGNPRPQKPSSPRFLPSSERKKAAIPEGPGFRSDVNTVNLDVAVVDNKGNFIPRIPKEAFRVLEDGIPQTVSTFGIGEGPMTVTHGDRVQQSHTNGIGPKLGIRP